MMKALTEISFNQRLLIPKTHKPLCDPGMLSIIVLILMFTSAAANGDQSFKVVNINPDTPPAMKIAVQACAGLHNLQKGGSVYTHMNDKDSQWLKELNLIPDEIIDASSFLETSLRDFPKCVRYSYSNQQKLLPNILTVSAVLEAVPLDGNVFKAEDEIEFIYHELECMDHSNDRVRKLLKMLEEFWGYIKANRPFIPNYGDRYRHNEAISSSIAEASINHVVSKRFVKKQQMRWTKRGAHLLLQTRVKVLNKKLRQQFLKWYPKMEVNEEVNEIAA